MGPRRYEGLSMIDGLIPHLTPHVSSHECQGTEHRLVGALLFPASLPPENLVNTYSLYMCVCVCAKSTTAMHYSLAGSVKPRRAHPDKLHDTACHHSEPCTPRLPKHKSKSSLIKVLPASALTSSWLAQPSPWPRQRNHHNNRSHTHTLTTIDKRLASSSIELNPHKVLEGR